MPFVGKRFCLALVFMTGPLALISSCADAKHGEAEMITAIDAHTGKSLAELANERTSDLEKRVNAIETRLRSLDGQSAIMPFPKAAERSPSKN